MRIKPFTVALGATVITLSAAAGVATAADPADGTISDASPKVAWTGSVMESVIAHHWYHTAQNDELPCRAPTCDSFQLTVANPSRELVVSVDAGENDAANVGVRVELPDGTYARTNGPAAPGKPLKLRLKNVTAGQYVVDYTNYYVGGSVEYNGTAELAPVAGAAGPTNPSPSGPTGVPESGESGEQPATKLTVKAGKASARKLTRARKYTITASTSAPLTQVVAKFLKGKKVIATGKLARLEGTAKLALKISKKAKLRKGSYTVSVTGVDEQNRQVSGGAKVKLSK